MSANVMRAGTRRRPAAGPAAVRTWLIGQVALSLGKPLDEVDAVRSLVEQGFDSVYALTLCGAIEDHYGIETVATLPWDYPSIDAITGYLVGELTNGLASR